MHPLRNHKSYIAAIGHRLSGIALAAFLPVHFLLLGTALEGAAELDAALTLADLPLVKIAEWGLVVLLTLHLLFGLRVLALEFINWPNHAETLPRWVLPSIVTSLFVGMVFLFNAF
ncbi:MAG: succinate dehydrogenase [Gammaproteobacteria bacterium]|nr:succinate dehydrogenase [Gammaproteobacteria bacterium]